MARLYVWLATLAILGALVVPGLGPAYADQRRQASPAGAVFNLGVAAAADVLTTSVVVTAPVQETSEMRLTIALLQTDSVVDIRMSDTASTDSQSFSLNAGASLSAGSLFTFTFGGHRNYTYNVRCQTATTVGYLLLEEVRSP